MTSNAETNRLNDQQSPALQPLPTDDEMKIVVYDDRRHHDAFRDLNLQWISSMFKVEPIDINILNHPVENILQPGGCILMAEYQGRTVGSIALERPGQADYDFELVKFAVSPTMRGKGLGRLLMEHCLETARSLGAQKIFIETNTKCAAAIHLYHQYGFVDLPAEAIKSGFARCDLQLVRTE